MGESSESNVEIQQQIPLEDDVPTSWNPAKVLFLMLVRPRSCTVSLCSKEGADQVNEGSWKSVYLSNAVHRWRGRVL